MIFFREDSKPRSEIKWLTSYVCSLWYKLAEMLRP